MPHRTSAVIRSAVPDDVEAVAALHVRSWRRGFGQFIAAGTLADVNLADRVAFWGAGFARPSTDAFTLVADDGSGITGACLIEVSCTDDDITDPRVAEIAALYVDPAAWRTGTGSSLLASARENLRARGQHAWTLWTLAEHAGTRAFYAREGFTPDHRGQRRHHGTGANLVRLRAEFTPTTRAST